MSFSRDMESKMSEILNETWSIREGTVIPSTEDVALKNGAVRIEATFLYADLAGSTKLQKDYYDTFSAKAIKMYLAGASAIIREYGGQIRSFDGDRVMGVFTGKSKCNSAVLAAFAIQWLVTEVINPLVKQRHLNNNTAVWQASHGIGIDVGETFVARAGVRNSSGETTHNDLIFTNRAPNIAAKLSALRGEEAGPITITEDVFNLLNVGQKKYEKTDQFIWCSSPGQKIGPYTLNLYKTSYWRHK